MVALEAMEKTGIRQYDQLMAFYKQRGIKPSFEAKYATITFIEETTDTNQPDCIIYVIDAAAETSPIDPIRNDGPAGIIIVVNKM